MKKYNVVVVKEAAVNALTQQPTKKMEQKFTLYADNKQKAHLEAHRLCTLPLEDASITTFIDGKEHLDERSL